MILLDFSQVIFGQIHNDLARGTDNTQDVNLFRHLVINQVRSYNKKYRRKYGNMVICLDSCTGYWRREVFPFYKWSRGKSRTESDIDWEALFEMMNQVRDEIAEELPQLVFGLDRCEADDTIAVIAKQYPVSRHLIISSDKDFRQLQVLGNIDQYSPITRKMIKDDNPEFYCFEHIIRGDGGDGIPNILTPGDFFKQKYDGILKRQKPITKKFVDEAWNVYMTCIQSNDSMNKFFDWLGPEVAERFRLNNRLVNLVSGIPDDIQTLIREQFDKAITAHRGKKVDLYGYFARNRMKRLLEDVADFDLHDEYGSNQSPEEDETDPSSNEADLTQFMK